MLRVFLLFALLTVPAAAQTIVSPSPFFGALMFPDREPVNRLGLNFDRFTEFSKKRDANGEFIREPYNGIDRTIGFNLVTATTTRRLAGSRHWRYRVILQAGYFHNQPTSYLQNDLMHSMLDLDATPVGETYEGFNAGAALDFTHWGRFLNGFSFYGFGVGGGTIAQQGFVHAGIRGFKPLLISWVQFSAMIRAGVVRPGEVFGDNFSDYYVNGQAALRLFGAELGYTWARGPFGKAGTLEPIDERFVTLRIQFGRGVYTFEVWNDLINEKDQGPTGGGRVYINADQIGWARKLVRVLFPW